MNAPPTWLELDQDHARNTGRLRLIAAVVTATAGVWLRISVAGAWVWAVLGASALACIFWVRSFARAGTEPSTDAVFADAEGFYRQSSGGRVFVPWCEIDEVSLDEERGAVVLTKVEGDPLILQDRYGNLGLEALHAWIEQRRPECHNEKDGHGKI